MFESRGLWAPRGVGEPLGQSRRPRFGARDGPIWESTGHGACFGQSCGVCLRKSLWGGITPDMCSALAEHRSPLALRPYGGCSCR